MTAVDIYLPVRRIVDDLLTPIAPEFAKIVGDAVMTTEQRVANVTIDDADVALAPLVAKYFNQNLGISLSSLPPHTDSICHLLYLETQYSISIAPVPVPYPKSCRKCCIAIVKYISTYSSKSLDKRQRSMVHRCIGLLVQFFHADGDSLGLPLSLMKTCSGFVPSDSKHNKEISRQLF